MKLIKKLDIFILKNYLMLFAGTFCISLFVVMMQFLWKYVDELVGKGLEVTVIAKFFFYAGETLVPLALPLAILLASLISFGNLGEKLELLAIKAAGISLIRTLRPLIIFNVLMMGASFYFQNNIAPQAQENLLTLLYSIRQKSPELDIPEGAFYNGIDGMNLYVERKDKDSGMLYNVIIYNMKDGVNNAHIILADSANMESTSDKKRLLLHLFSGEQFENLSNNSLQVQNVPYRRETFVEKHFIIDFDSNFDIMENSSISTAAQTKSEAQILEGVDSIHTRLDSLSIEFYNEYVTRSLYIGNSSRAFLYRPLTADMVDTIKTDSTQFVVKKKAYFAMRDTTFKRPKKVAVVDIDSVFLKQDQSKQQQIVLGALQRINIVKMDSEYKMDYINAYEFGLRNHWMNFWTKITMSLTCLLFFFIGAPLGSIIRKGGLGLPVVIAVLIFILYYIIDTGGRNLYKTGTIPAWIGLWISVLIMVPLGIWFTVKSNNDSVVFNFDVYREFFRRLFGIRTKRHIVRKEVIIDDPDYTVMADTLKQLERQARHYLRSLPRRSPLRYLVYTVTHIFSNKKDEKAEEINTLMEYSVDVLSNSKDRKILMLLNYYPVMDTASFRFYRRRKKDMKAIIKYSKEIREHIYADIIKIQ